MQKLKGVTGRILIVYFLVFILFGTGIILTKMGLGRIRENNDITANVHVPQINMANEVKAAVLVQEMYVKDYIDGENPLTAKMKFRENERLIRDRLKKLVLLDQASANREILDAVIREYDEFTLVVNNIFKVDAGRTALTRILVPNYAIAATNINKSAEQLVGQALVQISSSTGETNSLTGQLTRTNLVVSFLALAAGITAVWLLSSWISRPVNELASALGILAQGDLTQKVKSYNITEFELLGSSFNQMSANLGLLISRIARAATELSLSSKQLSDTSGNVNRAVGEVAAGMETVVVNGELQTENMEQATQMLNEVNGVINQIADRVGIQAENIKSSSCAVQDIAILAQDVNTKAHQLTVIAGKTGDVAERGGQTVVKAVTGMNEIKNIVSDSSQAILSLVEHSKEIEKTVQLISEIADQTNLLALNARIEAARAGEAGKGFAVIAEQVRQLADKSRSATQQVSALVSTIQNGVTEAGAAMEKIVTETNHGGDLVADVGKSLGQIVAEIRAALSPIKEISELIDNVSQKTNEVVEMISSVSELAQDNAGASQGAAEKAAQINNIVLRASSADRENVDAARGVNAHTEEISTNIRDVAASAQQLSETAEELNKLIAQFRLG